MSDLDLTRPHIVTAPHRIPFTGTWVAFCTCGGEFQGATAEEVRVARRPHWEAEQRRLSKLNREGWGLNGGSAVGAPGRGVPVSPKSAEAPRTT